MAGFQSLSRREKVLIVAVIPLAVAVAAWHFAWKPLTESRARSIDAIADYQLVADSAALAGTEVARPRPVNDTPLATRITDAAATANLPLRRIEPEGSGMRVTLDDVPFATVMLWLADMEDAHGVTTSAIELNRRPEPGIVSARLLLEPLQ